jgi:CRISPR-associated protein (TIGR03986 family)
MRHDRFEGDKHSGVIACTVEAKSPIFIGDEKPEGSPEVLGFKLGGIPALPASSLRGMVSSIAEAASNSALRILSREVLGAECYSYRKPVNEAITAIGKLVKDGVGWKLQPICLPNLQYDGNGKLRSDMYKWETVFPIPVFRVYRGTHDEIRAATWKGKTGDSTTVNVSELAWPDVKFLVPLGTARQCLHIKDAYRGNQLVSSTVVAQDEKGANKPQNAILRVLGCYERVNINGEDKLLRQIPETKKHELALPLRDKPFKCLPIPQGIVECFQQLANQMTEDSKTEDSPRPYEPKDTRQGRKSSEKLEPREGDLVFFDVDAAGKAVTEFSYSSIWRDRVETIFKQPASAWSFFESVDPNLLPFCPKRKSLTLAERVFGFVEQDGGEEVTNGLHWKGRVRFSHGIAVTPIDEMDLVPLKELSGPKPPSPAMYFRNESGANRHIAKNKLAPQTHWPQGRKFYLHHLGAINGNTPHSWEQTPGEVFQASRHVRIRPWGKGGIWRFEIRFDNLNDLELGFLLYALKPAETFLHKLGMGKPIGLGSIAVTLDSVRTVDRVERYSATGWDKPRFNEGILDLSKLRKDFREGINPEIRAALETLGDPDALDPNIMICYPSCEGAQAQGKNYEWFVSNEDLAIKAKKEEDRAKREKRQPQIALGSQPEALQPVVVKGPNNQLSIKVTPLRKLPLPGPHHN